MKKPAKSKAPVKRRSSVSQKAKVAAETKKNHDEMNKLELGYTLGKDKLAELNHSRKVAKDAKSREKAKYLASLPKSRVKRILYRLHPKRVFGFWFSKKGMIFGLKLAGVGFALMLVFVLGLFTYFGKDLADPREISSRILNQSTKFYDKTGETLLFEVYGDENRTVVDFDEISDAAKWATVAVEDKDFYEHGGVSFSGIARAAVSNVASGDSTQQGGSTITQQFIKNSLLSTEQTYTRKIKEIILALELERLYEKDEILSFYLNEIPYGPQEYGIQAASRSYFNKDAKDIGIPAAAILAALPQAPTYFSPYGENTDDLIDRQHVIINLMRDQGYITAEEAESAKKVDILKFITPIDEKSLYTDIIAPHYVLEVQRQLEDIFGPSLVNSGGLKVRTTLDLDLQKIAEDAVTTADGGDGFCDTGFRCGDNAAFVATEVETGHVVALVGSRDFDYPGYGSFNAALAERQPGSSFKPFDYAQLFYNDRWGPDSNIYDTQTSFGDYQPKNFDFGYRGTMTVRKALGESRNIPAVKAASIAGIDEVAKLAIAMGNKSLEDDEFFDLSYSLGAGEVKLAEHAHAFGTFARGGKYLPQTYILDVENADGDSLLEWEQEDGEQVLDEQIAYLITDALEDDVARSGTFGRNSPNLVVPGVNHTVKTGTTDNSVDGWMMGYTDQLSFGVWVGNHDNEPMGAALTSQQTGPIFTQFIADAYEQRDDLDGTREIFETRPDGIQTVALDATTGYAATESTKTKRTAIFPSWYKPETSDSKVKYTADKVSGLKATKCTPPLAREERTGGGLWPEVLPDDFRFASWSKSAGYSSSGGGPTEEDDVHDCDDEEPRVSLGVTKLSDTEYRFTAFAQRGTFLLDELNFKVNDKIVSAQSPSGNGGTYSTDYTFTAGGSFKVTAEAIDRGLYQDEDSETVSVNSASPLSVSISSPSDGATGVALTDSITWTSVSGASAYRVCAGSTGGGASTCVNVGNTTSAQFSSVLSPGDAPNYDVYVEARSGGSTIATSGTISISL